MARIRRWNGAYRINYETDCCEEKIITIKVFYFDFTKLFAAIKKFGPIFIYFTEQFTIMPRGRPKKLSNYEQVKTQKIRKLLSAQNIRTFDSMNNSNLLNTVHIDSEGKVFVSYDFHKEGLQNISKFVNEFVNKYS